MATTPQDAKELFDEQIPAALKAHPDKAKAVGAIYCFKISGDGGGDWTVDLASDPPACVRGDSGKAKHAPNLPKAKAQKKPAKKQPKVVAKGKAGGGGKRRRG